VEPAGRLRRRGADGSRRARVGFEWLPGRRFLVERWEVPVPEAPDGIAIIGVDPDSEGNYLQHYFDSRGVARVYRMSFRDGVWKLWRYEPDFRAARLLPALHRLPRRRRQDDRRLLGDLPRRQDVGARLRPEIREEGGGTWQ
jgi:hypothetical protein